MGQVYRATDTKLKRQVAIKILPPSLAANGDRLARFQREAEVLASLNHPNIGAIYGFENDGDVHALDLPSAVSGARQTDSGVRRRYASTVGTAERGTVLCRG
jgi:serine/threonine protein kinase